MNSPSYLTDESVNYLKTIHYLPSMRKGLSTNTCTKEPASERSNSVDQSERITLYHVHI